MSISIGAQPIPWADNGRRRDLDGDDPAVRFDGVSRRFGETVVLEDVSFTVPRGTVVGLLGSNGAGKSTAIRILLGHARADAGSAQVFGRPLRDHPLPLSRVGAVAESVGLLPWMGAADWLESVCRAAGFPRERIAAVLDQTDAASFAKKPIKTLSSGMRQRVALATALLGDPDLLVLDEPQNGLDPDGIRWLRGLLREFAGSGRSVLLSSHLLSEVEQSVDRVVMIRTRVLFEGTLAELPYPGRLEESYFALVDLERGREQTGSDAMKASLFRAELFRARRSRSTWILPAAGAVFLGLSLLGNVSVEHTKLVQGRTTPAEASYYLIGLAFIMLLFSALSGVLSVTSEYRYRSMGVSVLVTPSRTPILMAKAKVAALMGSLYGLLGVAVAFGLSAVALSARGDALVVSGRTVGLAVAIVAVVALAGPWGTFVGAVVRSQLAAVIGTIVYVSMGEAAILHYFPAVGRWLLGGAQAAVLADPSVADRLGRLAGSGLLLGWIVATAAVAIPLFRNQEL